jgi:hypothetical protein
MKNDLKLSLVRCPTPATINAAAQPDLHSNPGINADLSIGVLLHYY